MGKKSWSKEAEVYAWRMLQRGANWSEIGRSMGKTGKAVKMYFRRRGWGVGTKARPAHAEIWKCGGSPGVSSVQLCWSCRKAVGGCSWSRSFEPVPGWTAVEVPARCGTTRTGPWYEISERPEYAEG